MLTPQLFTTRPVTVEAVQYTGTNSRAIVEWLAMPQVFCAPDPSPDPTLITDGMLLVVNGQGARINDWVIRGANGQAYLRNPGIFVSSYAPAVAQPAAQ